MATKRPSAAQPMRSADLSTLFDCLLVLPSPKRIGRPLRPCATPELLRQSVAPYDDATRRMRAVRSVSSTGSPEAGPVDDMCVRLFSQGPRRDATALVSDRSRAIPRAVSCVIAY